MLTFLRNILAGKRSIPDIDIGALQRRCTMSEASYIRECVAEGYKHVQTMHGKRPGYYLYKDNGASILAVAHLDTVLPQYRSKFKSKTVDGYKVVISSELDDRLGAYIILDYLKKFDLQYDILLTTNEESGGSTASDFEDDYAGKKAYNWIFEFDRAKQGKINDTVLYDYGNDAFEKIVEQYFTVGWGSFTDICELEKMGSAALNIGCGYQQPHSVNCFVILDDVKTQVQAFLKFYRDKKDEILPFGIVQGGRWSWYNDDYKDDYDYGKRSPVIYGAKHEEQAEDRCDITDEMVEVKDLRLIELEDFSVISVHKYFEPLLLKPDGEMNLYETEKFNELKTWWDLLTFSEQNRFIADNFFTSYRKNMVYANDDTDDTERYEKKYLSALSTLSTSATQSETVDSKHLANIQCERCTNWFSIPLDEYPQDDEDLMEWMCEKCTKEVLNKASEGRFWCECSKCHLFYDVEPRECSDEYVCNNCTKWMFRKDFPKPGGNPARIPYYIQAIMDETDVDYDSACIIYAAENAESKEEFESVVGNYLNPDNDNHISTTCDICHKLYLVKESKVEDDQGICPDCLSKMEDNGIG